MIEAIVSIASIISITTLATMVDRKIRAPLPQSVNLVKAQIGAQALGHNNALWRLVVL